MGLRVVQIGSNKGNDELSEYIFNNYDDIEFGLFVEANSLHIEELKKCYEKYDNIKVENIGIKTPLQKQDTLTFYYHTNEHPHYAITTCNIDHLKKHMSWCPHLQGGEVKSFEVSCITLDELFQNYGITEIDFLFLDVEGLDAEILLTFDWKKYKIKKVEFESLHLGEYAESVKNMMIGMGYFQVESLHPYNWSFEKKQFISLKNKLKNFPSVNFISIEESDERRNLLYEKFKEYDLNNVTPHIFKKYDEKDHIIFSDIPFFGGGKGPTTSHLKAIKDWYFDTDEEYAFFCEDDLSLETVQHWNFTWEEFLSSLPPSWECVQLCLVREDIFTFYQNGIKLRSRCWCDWSACAYLIKRSHAKKLIKTYYKNGDFTLNYKGSDYNLRLSDYNYENFLRPTVETVIFTKFTDEESIFTFPLFVEDSINFSTTWCDNENSVNVKSYLEIIEWWKFVGSKLSLCEINLHESPQKKTI